MRCSNAGRGSYRKLVLGCGRCLGLQCQVGAGAPAGPEARRVWFPGVMANGVNSRGELPELEAPLEVVRSRGKRDSKTPVLVGTESPSLLGREGVGSPRPGTEMPGEARVSCYVWRRGISGFLNRNHPQDPGKHIAEKIQSIGDSRDWRAVDKISKIRSGYRTGSGSRLCGGVLGVSERSQTGLGGTPTPILRV